MNYALDLSACRAATLPADAGGLARRHPVRRPAQNPRHRDLAGSSAAISPTGAGFWPRAARRATGTAVLVARRCYFVEGSSACAWFCYFVEGSSACASTLREAASGEPATASPARRACLAQRGRRRRREALHPHERARPRDVQMRACGGRVIHAHVHIHIHTSTCTHTHAHAHAHAPMHALQRTSCVGAVTSRTTHTHMPA